ncbi:exonuclease mut-7 homolog [Culex quinquefasciatus]|uniref:exonuclease mut-7 homolog n=1 Tax=Culex quinquefasciatus TaxID=7176 RepID=UPI0018E35D80|nr:exonuclease mut-7 homolog [Culex quinquefasciatus]
MTDSGAPRFMPAGYDSDNTTEDELVMPGGLNDSGSSGLGGGGGCLEDERIKIVPHLGWRAGLLEQDFEIELVPETIATWFEGFKDSFKTYKKGPIISQRLQMFYMNTQNPFEWALKLFANCPDHSSPKSNSLAYTVIEELNSFKKRYTPATDQLVDDNLRMVAFNFMTKQTHCLLFRLAVDTYELLRCREMFVPKVRAMLARKQYKEAGQIAVDLELFDHFDEHDFVMPLFLQDKISIAEDFLNRAVRLQRPVVQLLDSFFSKKESVESLCSRYITEHNVTDVYYSKLHQKPLSKLVQRLAKSYNIPKEFTPNVNKMKNFGALQFLCHKRYYEKGLNKDSWDEMVRDTVSEADRDLQLELVCLCSGFGDQAEAAKWAEHFRLKRKELPLLVQDYFAENEGTVPRSRPSQLDEKWDDPVATETKLTLPLDESRVHLVDSREKFFAMTSDLSQQSLVAFDSEWKPTFGGANEVAVIQLATRDDVYLVDVLVSQLQGSDWSELASVFNRDDVLKLAFAPSTDFNMFQKALPAFNVSYGPQSGSMILDLQVLWRKVDAIKSFQFPFKEEITNQNLSNLAKLCLGKKLDKSNQFSNWAQRPLRREQIQYAALDAYVLLQIYDVIAKQLKAARIDLNEVLNGLLCPEGKSGEGGSKKRSSGGSGSSRRGNRGDKYNKRPEGGSSSRDSQQHNRNRMRSSFERPPGPNLNSVLVSDVRFVCDKMLEGLAKMLRRFGIDAVTIPAGEQADRCVFIAHNEKRYVLTRGNNYQKFADNLPSGHCYKVSNDQVDDQLLEVLAYYKIVIRQENIFSRCQLCNCGRFLQATPDQVYYMKHRTQMPATLREEHRKPTERDGKLQLDRSWVLERLEERHLKVGKTDSGVRIDVAYVNDSVLANVDVLYVCSGCGKCYWDGSHLDNILAGKLEDLLTLKYD